jgi:heat shock protein HslJ
MSNGAQMTIGISLSILCFLSCLILGYWFFIENEKKKKELFDAQNDGKVYTETTRNPFTYNCASKEMWTVEKTKWCKENQPKPKYNCASKEMWTVEKTKWCKENPQIAYTPAPYDCRNIPTDGSWPEKEKWCTENMKYYTTPKHDNSKDTRITDLTSKTWKWSDSKKKEFSLTFKDNAVSITGCNSMWGEYTKNGNNLTFGPMATTLVACEDWDEYGLHQKIQSVKSFNIENGKLILYDKNDKELLSLK